MVYGGIFPTFPDPEHGKAWLKPWHFNVVKQSAGEVTVAMSIKDGFCVFRGAKAVLRSGRATGIEATYYVTLKADRAALDARVVLKKSAKPRRSITSTGPARRWRRDRTRNSPKTTGGAEIIAPIRPTRRRRWSANISEGDERSARAGAVSKNCATSKTGRRWASPMPRPTCRAETFGV